MVERLDTLLTEHAETLAPLLFAGDPSQMSTANMISKLHCIPPEMHAAQFATLDKLHNKYVEHVDKMHNRYRENVTDATLLAIRAKWETKFSGTFETAELLENSTRVRVLQDMVRNDECSMYCLVSGACTDTPGRYTYKSDYACHRAYFLKCNAKDVQVLSKYATMRKYLVSEPLTQADLTDVDRS